MNLVAWQVGWNKYRIRSTTSSSGTVLYFACKYKVQGIRSCDNSNPHHESVLDIGGRRFRIQ
jgi:hypothetical protein